MNSNFQRNFILVLLVSVLVISLLTVFAAAESKSDKPKGISARSAALYCPDTGEFLYEKNSGERLPMASTTKIMTALIALERGDPEKTVRIPREATGIEGSSIYLEEGEELRLGDLIYALLLQSANDAATAIATEISGDSDSFSRLMNEKAQSLGLFDTHFENPHGLDAKEHYTTARDLAFLSAAALGNESFRKITSTYKHSFTSASGKERTVVNHNKLLNMYKDTVGVKTGFTKKTGRCLVSAAQRDGLTLIAVTLNAPDDWRDHMSMLDFGFEHFESTIIAEAGTFNYSLPVTGGVQERVTLTNAEALRMTLPKERGALKYKVEALHRFEFAPISKGEALGRVYCSYDDRFFAESVLVCSKDIDKSKERSWISKLIGIFS